MDVFWCPRVTERHDNIAAVAYFKASILQSPNFRSIDEAWEKFPWPILKNFSNSGLKERMRKRIPSAWNKTLLRLNSSLCSFKYVSVRPTHDILDTTCCVRCMWYSHINRASEISQTFRSHHQILDVRMVTWSKFHTQEPQLSSDLWTSLSCCAFCLLNLKWCIFFT